MNYEIEQITGKQLIGMTMVTAIVCAFIFLLTSCAKKDADEYRKQRIVKDDIVCVMKYSECFCLYNSGTQGGFIIAPKHVCEIAENILLEKDS